MKRHLVLRSQLLVAVAVLLLAAAPSEAAGASLQATASDGTIVTATLDGVPIPPATAYRYNCHTRDYPAVRCFETYDEVTADLAASTSTMAPAAAASFPIGAAYTIAYWDSNYRGTSFTIYGDFPDLRTVGWNDAISSMKSVNCGYPAYYQNIGYGGWIWQNGCNVWTPNLGYANDQFSSVRNAA